MAEGRLCLACGADLAGPFLPRLDLARPAPGEGAGAEVAAHSWVCPECGLVHWYADAHEPEADAVQEAEERVPRAGSSYERRSEIVRMLRRVKRM